MDVREDAGLSSAYRLKLNSYDLGVDIELADAVQRIRFEHPEVHAVVVTSLKERIFCAGANIMMLRESSHSQKVNFCKFTNETRLAIEDASAAFRNRVPGRGQRRLRGRRLRAGAGLRRDPAGRRRQLRRQPARGAAARCAARHRRPDAVVDKRRVRRDLADIFSTLVEGVKGKRAVDWRLVDAVYPRAGSRRRPEARASARREVRSPSGRPRHDARPARSVVTDTAIDLFGGGAAREPREADRRPDRAGADRAAADAPPRPSRRPAIDSGRCARFVSSTTRCCGCASTSRKSARSCSATEGDLDAVLAVDRTLAEHAVALARPRDHLDDEADAEAAGPDGAQFLRLIEPGSASAGSLFELALAADRSYMLDDRSGTTSSPFHR